MRLRHLGVAVSACVVCLGAGSAVGAGSASAERMLRIYEPNQAELVPPAPLTLTDPTYQHMGAEGGFNFRVGTPSNQFEEAECAGTFDGEIVTDNTNKDEIRLASGSVGEAGMCEGPFGTSHIAFGNFPLKLIVSSSGKVSTKGEIEVAIEDGPGLPPSCLYKGKISVPGKVPTAGVLTMNVKGDLRSPSRSCLQLYFVSDEAESGVITAYGAQEALYTLAF
jgi:hypothetical protein